MNLHWTTKVKLVLLFLGTVLSLILWENNYQFAGTISAYVLIGGVLVISMTELIAITAVGVADWIWYANRYPRRDTGTQLMVLPVIICFILASSETDNLMYNLYAFGAVGVCLAIGWTINRVPFRKRYHRSFQLSRESVNWSRRNSD